MDYNGVNQTIVFNPDGPSLAQILIEITQDGLVERDETFSIGLITSQRDAASGNIIIGRDVAQITIVDFDSGLLSSYCYLICTLAATLIMLSIFIKCMYLVQFL